MIPSSCLNPVRVYDPCHKVYHYVPCGHCDGCVCGKGYNRSTRLSENLARFSHKYFVTLTFADDYLPIAKYDDLTDSFVHPYDFDYDGVIYSVPSEAVILDIDRNESFRDSFKKYKGVPVLSHKLAINFKKRLRKQFSKIYGKQYLFIYIVGEYGPLHYRPHYHCLFGTNAPVRTSIFESLIHSAWSHYNKSTKEFDYEYGRIDVQTVFGKGAARYVSQYLNCISNLPACLSQSLFRPFFQSSPLISGDDLQFKNPSLEKMFSVCSPEMDCESLQDNTCSVSLLPPGLVNRFFPKCYRFDSLIDCDRLQFYAVFQKFSNLSADSFAKCVLDSFSTSNDSVGLCKQLLVDSDYRSSYTRLVRHFYLSRRVCLNARKLNVSLDVYVNRIVLFWSRYELLKLRNFYELQIALLEDSFNPCTLSDLFSLYFDTDDNIKNLGLYLTSFGFPNCNNKLSNLAVQSNYRNLMHNIVLDTTKTKKRNDHFSHNGFVIPSFISKFKIKHNVLSFFKS